MSREAVFVTTATSTAPTRPAASAPTPNVRELRCRACGEPEPLAPVHVCSWCFGPLGVVYDDEVAGRVSRERITAGPPTLWRYADLLPVLSSDPSTRVDLGTGFGPLRPAPRLGARLGLDDLWIKDDTRNPSGSFKDRVVTCAVSAARAFGIETVACASTGNLANSVAAHAAATGMDAYVLVPADLERAKIVGSAAYGAKVVAVDGSYDDVNRLASELADARGWGFANVNLRAFYAEGSRTIGFEIAEQLGWQLPDHVVLPVASGSLLTKVHESFGQLVRYGLVDEPDAAPRISGAQATGCSPVARAFEDGSAHVRPQRPSTIARSLAIGDPADGDRAVDVARSTGGAIGHVPDDEVVAGIRLLAETEGLFAETAGGVTIATLARLAAAGVVRRDEQVVAVVTGVGHKTVEALADTVGPAFEVPPSFDVLTAELDRAGA